jgi:hypothetical protein
MAEHPSYPAFAPHAPQLAEVQALPDSELVRRYSFGVENLDRRVFELEPGEIDTAFFPEAGVGRWPARVLLGHLADAELAQVHRMRRTTAESHPVLSTWDEQAFIEGGLYARGEASSPGAFVAVVHTLRKWTTPWLASLTPAQWGRTALHPERGELSVRVMCHYITWHLEHHAWYLNRKVALLLSKRG